MPCSYGVQAMWVRGPPVVLGMNRIDSRPAFTPGPERIGARNRPSASTRAVSYARTGMALGHIGGSSPYRSTNRVWNPCTNGFDGSNWSMPTQPSKYSKPARYHMNAVLMILGGSQS